MTTKRTKAQSGRKSERVNDLGKEDQQGTVTNLHRYTKKGHARIDARQTIPEKPEAEKTGNEQIQPWFIGQ